MRLERRNALKEVKRREQQVVDTLKLTSEICTQRHHEGLFGRMKDNLPGFFGFQAVGVLMLNQKENYFFSDPDSAAEKKKQDEEEAKKETDKKTSGKPSEMTEQEKQDKIRAIHNKRFMNYPTNSGISGQVFKSKQLYFSNNASKESKFVEEVDD